MRYRISKLFDGIDEESCCRMLKCFDAREMHYPAGQTIIEYTGGQQEIGVMLSGCAELVRLDEDGNRTILESMTEGDVFGEVLAFSAQSEDSMTVECREACDVLFLRYDQITKRCENACLHHSTLVQNMFQLLSTKTLHLSERVEVLSCRSIREKLLRYFQQQCAHTHSRTFSLPFSLSALADYIGTDRSAMMRELKKLREEGIIRTDNREITMLT